MALTDEGRRGTRERAEGLLDIRNGSQLGSLDRLIRNEPQDSRCLLQLTRGLHGRLAFMNDHQVEDYQIRATLDL